MKIILEEQGLRDGLQNLEKIIPTQQKLNFIDQLVDAGLKRIQVASFVHPRLVPQMADAKEVCKGLKKKEGVVYSGLVLNLKGVERGIAAELDHLSCSISASNIHSQKNIRRTLQEAKLDFKDMVKLCQDNEIIVRGGIQCAFGCRYEGRIEEDHVLDMVKHHLDLGINEIALADSTGMANPNSLFELMTKVIQLAEGKPVILHLHNTEGKGLVNLYAAIKAGVHIFDTAFGGLGGCPFIKSATGNIATEDTVNMLNQMGYETGIDIKKIVAMSEKMSGILGYPLPGQIYKLWNEKDIKLI